MPGTRAVLVFVFLCFVSLMSHAEETISFKGIKFGMSADEIAVLGGGNTETGCASAIKRSRRGVRGDAWTYGGIDTWQARCMEGYADRVKVPGVTGLIELGALVPNRDRSASENAYSIEDLVNIFSQVFGKFSVVKFGDVTTAIASHKGAQITITNRFSDRRDFFSVTINSVEFLKKKEEWESRKEKKKVDGAKSDF